MCPRRETWGNDNWYEQQGVSGVMGSVFGSLRFGAVMLAGVVLVGCAQTPGTLEQWEGYEPQARSLGKRHSLQTEKAVFSDSGIYRDGLLSEAQGSKP